MKIHATFPKVTQPLLAFGTVVSYMTAMLLISKQNKSRVIDQNKTKYMMLRSDENKSPVVDVGIKQHPCDLANFLAVSDHFG